MSAAYEVYEHPHRGLRAAPRGFNWLAFLCPGCWALFRGLWLTALVLITLDVTLVVLAPVLINALPVMLCLSVLLPRLYTGINANAWLGRHWQRSGFLFLGMAESDTRSGAVRNVTVSRAVLQSSIPSSTSNWIDRFPFSVRTVLSIARLTVQAAVRFRIVQFLTVVLMVLVIALPIMLKHDGTAHGLTQIILSYSLASIITILGFATFWLAVGNLAREVEDGQLQMICAKPVSFWKILLGKWLGIMTINAVILFVTGTTVQFLLQWRAQQLPEEQRVILEQQILTARSSILAPLPDFDRMAEEKLATNNSENLPTDFDRNAALAQIRSKIITRHQGVLFRQQKMWTFPMGKAASKIGTNRLSMRVRFQAAGTGREPVLLQTRWHLGNANSSNHYYYEKELTTDTFHEIPIPIGVLDGDGNIEIRFNNTTGRPVIFDINDRPELLYREASFETNTLRAFAILFCWLGLGAAIGLAAASKLNFNVAAFFTMSLVIIGMFDGTIAVVSENATIWDTHSHGEVGLTFLQRAADAVLVPMIRFLNFLLGAINDYSPIESLSLGRSITWGQLATAYFQCWLVFGSLLAALAIFAFGRRELANPWQS